MKKLILIFLFPTLFFSSFFICSAEDNLSIEIEIKPYFSENEEIIFQYSFLSRIDQGITFVSHIKCPTAPVSPVEEKTIYLKANKLGKGEYNGGIIDESVEPQTCTAYVQIINPLRQKKEKKFDIKTRPSFDIQILFCKDKKCEQKTKIFKSGEILYLNYQSDIKNIKVTSELSLPDGSKTKLILPAFLKLNQEGKYTFLSITALMGYKTIQKIDEIVVLKDEVNFNDKRICNADSKCAGQENEQNCPQDCVKVKKPADKIIILIIAIAIIIAIMIAAYYFLIRKKSVPVERNER